MAPDSSRSAYGLNEKTLRIPLGAALSVQVQYLQLRGKTYQFRIRVPQHLVQRYGKPDIRKSFGTSDLKEAARKAEEEAPINKPEEESDCQLGVQSHGMVDLVMPGLLRPRLPRNSLFVQKGIWSVRIMPLVYCGGAGSMSPPQQSALRQEASSCRARVQGWGAGYIRIA
jgi:hypothetical protein